MNDNGRLLIQGNTHREQIIYESWKLWTSVICKKSCGAVKRICWSFSIWTSSTKKLSRRGMNSTARRFATSHRTSFATFPEKFRDHGRSRTFDDMISRRRGGNLLRLAGEFQRENSVRQKNNVQRDENIESMQLSSFSVSLSPFLFSFRSKESEKNSISLKNRVISYCLDTKDFSPKFRVTISPFIRRKKGS